jgi:uncharacterized protein (DUF3084 family)
MIIVRESLTERRLERKVYTDELDPMETSPREVFIEEDARDTSERVKDQFTEAGNNTRNANQYVKLVNAHIKNKVSQLERLKEAQKKFEEELDLFKMDSKNDPIPAVSQTSDPESALIVRELTTMINKHGIEKISKALDQILDKH